MSRLTPTGLTTAGMPNAMYCSALNPHFPRVHWLSGRGITPTSNVAASAISVAGPHGTNVLATFPRREKSNPAIVSEIIFMSTGACNRASTENTSLRYALVLRLPVQPIVTRPRSARCNGG